MTDEDLSWQVDQIGPGFVALPRGSLVWIEIDGEAVIYDERRPTTHLLNATGTIVWCLLDGKTRLDEISAELAEAFVIGYEQVLGDVVQLACEFGRRGLLENVAPEKAEEEDVASGEVRIS